MSISDQSAIPCYDDKGTCVRFGDFKGILINDNNYYLHGSHQEPLVIFIIFRNFDCSVLVRHQCRILLLESHLHKITIADSSLILSTFSFSKSLQRFLFSENQRSCPYDFLYRRFVANNFPSFFGRGLSILFHWKLLVKSKNS